mmetsp:Transcript_30847/g.45098  ORF Transcript_30847/g.45098 Transcript_30847/m.45098 type:complete len:186 (-) Transcript_30847:260-817(-)
MPRRQRNDDGCNNMFDLEMERPRKRMMLENEDMASTTQTKCKMDKPLSPIGQFPQAYNHQPQQETAGFPHQSYAHGYPSHNITQHQLQSFAHQIAAWSFERFTHTAATEDNSGRDANAMEGRDDCHCLDHYQQLTTPTHNQFEHHFAEGGETEPKYLYNEDWRSPPDISTGSERECSPNDECRDS